MDAFAVTGTAMGFVLIASQGELGPDVGQLCEQSVPAQSLLSTVKRVFGSGAGPDSDAITHEYTVGAATARLRAAVDGAIQDGTDSVLAVTLGRRDDSETEAMQVFGAQGMDLSGAEARGVLESLDPIASALQSAAPFLQSCIADSEQQATAAYMAMQQASPGLSQLISLTTGLVQMAGSQGLR